MRRRYISIRLILCVSKPLPYEVRKCVGKASPGRAIPLTKGSVNVVDERIAVCGLAKLSRSD